jgi:hypothetical protein
VQPAARDRRGPAGRLRHVLLTFRSDEIPHPARRRVRLRASCTCCRGKRGRAHRLVVVRGSRTGSLLRSRPGVVSGRSCVLPGVIDR